MVKVFVNITTEDGELLERIEVHGANRDGALPSAAEIQLANKVSDLVFLNFETGQEDE